MSLEIFRNIENLLKIWDIKVDDWLVTGKYARVFAGYKVGLRRNHINIVVDSQKIPWPYKFTDFAETIPNKNSEYYNDYFKFSYITDYDLDITPVNNKLFKQLRKNRQKKRIGDRFVYYASILDNLKIVKIKLNHCNKKELGAQKGKRLIEGIRDLLKQAKIKKNLKVAKECKGIIKTYRYKYIKLLKGKKIFKGLALGRGKIEGKVAIFKDGKTRKIFDPMILVTDDFTPRQLIYFNEILGIVAESGGLASHAAIVSKEFNLPVIMQVEGITELLKDGQYITMNLDTGKIKILDRKN